ncbi:hypothetical protein ACFSTE_00245 [Aquimarina hainanensis]|uniref:VOC family protein n=1 Tax=Aquimarina hainanensis TaxID=1578017 RepID=A0ABW5N4W1_9FLAO|nr:hypothetical protein [Aquimarina sp. TRL1]QKX04639.1 hypothetical protein HN014_06835 [Aquimarina sp. TRL1]
MNRMKLMAGHQQVMPYLVIEKADEFVEFIKRLFNAQEMIRRVDKNHKILHSEVLIGTSTLIITEANKNYPAEQISMYIYVNDSDQVYYRGIEMGATSVMAPMEENDDTRVAGLLDPFGNTWWLTTLQ